MPVRSSEQDRATRGESLAVLFCLWVCFVVPKNPHAVLRAASNWEPGNMRPSMKCWETALQVPKQKR